MKTTATLTALICASALVWNARAESGQISATGGGWKVFQHDNPEGPGSAVEITHKDQPVARLVHGDGQMKPFLHVFGPAGEMLTNPGIDRNGKPAGQFPHHRGIFIGWNKIESELGSDDLWHLNAGARMELVGLRKAQAAENGAVIEAAIVWRAKTKDDTGDDTLLRETRTLRVSRTDDGRLTTVDATFLLTPARKLKLNGDLQHAGVHFRAHRDVQQRASETFYLWAPDEPGGNGRIIHGEMRWCRFVFPLGDSWFSAIQYNPSVNPSEELSWRDYGRFGFFFAEELEKDEALEIHYRFEIGPVMEPRHGRWPDDAVKTARQRAEDAWDELDASL